MWLFYSPFHNFIHKVLVTAHEAGLWDRIERVATFPFKALDGRDGGAPYSLAAVNPLDKVPTLVLDTGQPVYGSQAIVEYLDSENRTGHRLYPAPGPERWDALRRLALADTIFENTVQLVMEGWHPPEQRRMAFYEWIWPKLLRGLDTMERDASRYGALDIGQIAALHALSYFDFIKDFYDAKDPLHPGFDWRDGHPALTAWYAKTVTRPSVQSHYKKEWQGDRGDRPEEFRRALDAVLAVQKKNGFR